MKIIIVGCGKVGETITARLADEGHDIAVVDIDSAVVNDITNSYDVMGVIGNGASYSVLKEAGIEDMDLMIAVTDSDELNLLSCLFAKKAGNCSTIARIRNPEYYSELDFIKEELGLSLTINPEYAAASEIARLLRFPSAIKIDTFARGRVELLQFVIPQGSILDGISLMDLRKKIKAEVLVCAVQRGQEVEIPNGASVLHAGETISIIAQHNHAKNFFKKIGVETHGVKNSMIIGGGKIAYYLAKNLMSHGIDVKIIDNNLARCAELSDSLPGAIIIGGDGTDHDLLMEEGIDTCESFVTLTGIDEENVFLSLYAQQQNPDAKIITKTNRNTIDAIIGQFHLGSMIHPKNITAEYILRYVRAMENSIGSNMETLYYIAEDKAEAMEFTIREDAPVIHTPLADLKTKNGVLIAAIIRDGQMFLPGGHSTIEVGDSVIVVTTHQGFSDIADIMQEN